MNEPQYVKGTLDWCNERRAELFEGLPLTELPKGFRGDASSCPCGKATGLRVWLTKAYEPADRKRYVLPEDVQKFVAAFDNGDLPQYEATNS